MTTSDPTPEQDECRIVEVNGEAIRVQASGEWDAEDHAAFAEIVRAAKRRMTTESKEPDPKPVCTCYLSGASGARSDCPDHGIEAPHE